MPEITALNMVTCCLTFLFGRLAFQIIVIVGYGTPYIVRVLFTR